MKLYIDPGTGSMLFAILIGIIGTLNYLLKGWFVKLRFALSGGKRVKTKMIKGIGAYSSLFVVNLISVV